VPDEADVIRSMLMFFILPLWLCAGFADWLCHRASHIATTSGPKESLIHLAMLAEMGVAVTLAMTFEVNALIILVMIICWALHEATAVWDVFFAVEHRVITACSSSLSSARRSFSPCSVSAQKLPASLLF
jgi:hypothetical protein